MKTIPNGNALSNRHRSCLSIVSAAVAATVLALSATPASADLSPDAQGAVKRGLIAAQEHDYLLAIHYFQDARRVAPDSAEIYFDLGLAESKIPGRELRAIAWFGAYLAAKPQASNAAQVRDEIDVLEVKSRSNISRLVALAADRQNMANVLQIVNSLGDFRGLATMFVFHAELNLAMASGAEGDVSSSLEMLKAVQETGDIPDMRTEVVGDESHIAVQLAWDGNYVGAERIVDIMPPVPASAPGFERYDDASNTRRWIAHIQLKHGDIPGALKTTNRVERDDVKASTLADIVNAQLDRGDIAAARRTALQITAGADKSAADRAIASLESNAAELSKRQALGPASYRPEAKTSVQLISELFGDGDDDASKPLNAPVILDLAGYTSHLASVDPSKVIPDFAAMKLPFMAAGSPVEMFYALAKTARVATDAQRMVDADVGAIVGRELN